MVDIEGLDSLSDDELDSLRIAIKQVQEKRMLLARIPLETDRLATLYAQATGRQDGDNWRQPVGAFDAYPLGTVVEHDGKHWASLVPANVWEPGTGPVSWTLWRDLSQDPDEGTDEDTPPPDDPVEGPQTRDWDGLGHSYIVGDIVVYEGAEYRCIQSHTSQPGWTPVAVRALWEPRP